MKDLKSTWDNFIQGSESDLFLYLSAGDESGTYLAIRFQGDPQHDQGAFIYRSMNPGHGSHTVGFVFPSDNWLSVEELGGFFDYLSESRAIPVHAEQLGRWAPYFETRSFNVFPRSSQAAGELDVPLLASDYKAIWKWLNDDSNDFVFPEELKYLEQKFSSETSEYGLASLAAFAAHAAFSSAFCFAVLPTTGEVYEIVFPSSDELGAAGLYFSEIHSLSALEKLEGRKIHVSIRADGVGQIMTRFAEALDSLALRFESSAKFSLGRGSLKPRFSLFGRGRKSFKQREAEKWLEMARAATIFGKTLRAPEFSEFVCSRLSANKAGLALVPLTSKLIWLP